MTGEEGGVKKGSLLAKPRREKKKRDEPRAGGFLIFYYCRLKDKVQSSFHMGKTVHVAARVPFRAQHVADRARVLEMLRFEDGVIRSERGRAIYRDLGMEAETSLIAEKTIHRVVLSQFGFDTSDASVEAYRTICAHYYRSPSEYDVEVMQAVAYFRSNKCLFYTSPPIRVGDRLPDCALLQLDGHTATSVHAQLGLSENSHRFTHALVAGFSTS
jgi:hypothetical protein